jgi:hypothetical protein
MDGYRSQQELDQRIIAYGGDCIRGKTHTFGNNPACNRSTVIYSRVKNFQIIQQKLKVQYGLDQSSDARYRFWEWLLHKWP